MVVEPLQQLVVAKRKRFVRLTFTQPPLELEALQRAAHADGHEVIGEFIDDGYSGARLDRPALAASETRPRPACSTA